MLFYRKREKAHAISISINPVYNKTAIGTLTSLNQADRTCNQYEIVC
jgi:hypothetical protein